MKNYPREFYWKDLELNELFGSNLFSELHKVFKQMAKVPMLFAMDEKAILNEVGYEVTWLTFQYERNDAEVVEQFVRQVYANTGIKEHAEAVMSLVFGVVKVLRWVSSDIGSWKERELKRINNECWCGRYVTDFIRRMDKEGRSFDDIFVPYQERYEEIPPPWETEEDACINGKEVTGEARGAAMMAAEPTPVYWRERSFTFNEIVAYIEEKVSKETAPYFQLMLHNLLVEDGTKEEREIVNTITDHIMERERNQNVKEVVIYKKAVSLAGDIVLKKETTIDKNYGPNIEQNGGTLSLPDSPFGKS